jgi:hypothetical protein
MHGIRTIEIDESIDRLTDWDLFDDKIIGKFSGFKAVSGNILGLRRRIIDEHTIYDDKKGPYEDINELGPDGINRVHTVPMKIHITRAGTPHRVPHGFGYWHINDMDEVILAIPALDGETRGHYIVVMQKPIGKEGESFAQYCQVCLTLIHEYRFNQGQLGINEFWHAEMAAASAFNATDRRCPECGNINHPAYCWNVAKDTPELAASRKLW